MQNHALRTRSGEVIIDCPLTSFLYTLMRDHLPAGEVERLVRDSISNQAVAFTNGWLARYAEDATNRLLLAQRKRRR